MNEKCNNKRYFMLDIIRIVCALVIFGRHAHTMWGYSFGNQLNQLFITLTGSIMSCFFILSGFSLFLANGKYNLLENTNLFFFYKKRWINILPVYYLVHILYICFFEKDIIKVVKLTPIELFGIQSIFNSLFSVLHNGGTWFVSCLLISYFIYPLIQEIVKSIPLNRKNLLLFLLLFLSIYLSYISSMQGETLYSHPLYRFIQFFLGVTLASIYNWEKLNVKKKNTLFPILLCVGSAFLVALSMYKDILLLQKFDIFFIGIAILYSTQIECKFFERSKSLRFLSGVTYEFYILQLFLWLPSSLVVNYFGLENCKYKILIPFIILLISSILVRELYEKPIQKTLLNKFVYLSS